MVVLKRIQNAILEVWLSREDVYKRVGHARDQSGILKAGGEPRAAAAELLGGVGPGSPGLRFTTLSMISDDAFDPRQDQSYMRISVCLRGFGYYHH